ncbi:MAG TPA: type 1 glutamine amidotransferase domain-containing protein [Flavobacteriaceae bacterium]|jgi:putative intracellular protease/amidase|nr:type 1 glutamine amidotransferase domain-containing protein [Flavobacteriaceae bacterium]
MNTKQLVLMFIASSMLLFSCKITETTSQKNKDKILFVLTNVSEKGNSNEKTGFWLSEITHVWKSLNEQGFEIDFISPQGGNAPVDPHSFDLKDTINEEFWKNNRYKNKILNTLKPSDINPNDYIAIHYVGGHGTMWDFPDNAEIANIAKIIYENNGFISAVCHGPAGLVNIKLSNGDYLVKGKKISAFTNEEEAYLKATNIVPFLLEDKLIERGAIFEKTVIWEEKVVVDERLITGQNPASAKEIGIILTNLIKK